MNRNKKVSKSARPLAANIFTLYMVTRFVRHSPAVAARLLVKLSGDPLDYWQDQIRDSPAFAAGYIWSQIK